MNKLLALALHYACVGRESLTHRRSHRLAALAVRKDGVLVLSHNATVLIATPEGHAEARVLRKAGYGATLYVARARRDGTPAMAMPCESCMALIRAKRVRRVLWTS